MSSNIQKTEKIAALCGMIWFATIIDACYTWFLPWFYRYLVGTPFVVYATLLLKQNSSLVLSVQRRRLFILFFIFFLFVLITHISPFYFIYYSLLYLPIFCLVFWPIGVLGKLYKYLRKFVVFYAVVSIFVEILVLSGIYTKLPCIMLPPYDTVQELLGINNRFYGLFVIPESMYDSVLTFYRAMGPLREGGHFSIFLGFIYFVETAVFDKRNIWIIVAGILTLSPNFVFFLFITEGYVGIVRKRVVKTLIGLVCFVVIVLGVVWFSPSFIQDEIIRVVLERNLQENIENVDTFGYMELLDGRTNVEGLQMWNQFVKRADSFSKMLGMSNSDLVEDFVLSDFRCLIFRYGYIGFLFIIICSMGVSFLGKNGFYGICVLLLGIWVMISRAWMFQQLYVWTMMLLAVVNKIDQDINSHLTCSVTEEHL